jgi:hypothetical protein
MIRPIRTMAPRRIHSQTRPVLDPLAAAAGLLAGTVLAGALRVGVAELGVADADDADAVGLGDTLWLGDELALLPEDELALRVGERLAMALLAALPHPAAMHPATRITAERTRLLVKRRMPDPSALS